MDILAAGGERRDTPRERVLEGARLINCDGQSFVGCAVRNISPTGALLQVESSLGISDEVILVIDGEADRRPGRVAWRAFQQVGVQFVLPGQDAWCAGNWVFPVRRRKLAGTAPAA